MDEDRPKWMRQVRGTGRHGVGCPPRGVVADPDHVEVALRRIRSGGTPPLLNVPERRAVVAELTGDGWSSSRIAGALGLAERNVQRHRKAFREAVESFV